MTRGAKGGVKLSAMERKRRDNKRSREYREKHREAINYENRVRWHSDPEWKKKRSASRDAAAQKPERKLHDSERRARRKAKARRHQEEYEKLEHSRSLSLRSLQRPTYVLKSEHGGTSYEQWPPEDEAQKWLDQQERLAPMRELSQQMNAAAKDFHTGVQKTLDTSVQSAYNHTTYGGTVQHGARPTAVTDNEDGSGSNPDAPAT